MISFLKNLKSYKLKAKSYKLNAGMTYVELIVVLSIFSVLSSVVIFNYGDFQARVDIKNLASDIALQVVQAQKSALSGALPVLGGYDSTWKPSYGVYFKSSSALDSDVPVNIPFNKKFIYFADLDNNNFYAGLPSCTTTECLNKVTITKNNSIDKLEVFPTSCGSGTPTIPTNFSIVFKRPDSGATMTADGTLLPSSTACVQITVKSPKGATALIKLYPSGRVQVN